MDAIIYKLFYLIVAFCLSLSILVQGKISSKKIDSVNAQNKEALVDFRNGLIQAASDIQADFNVAFNQNED